MKIIAFTDSGQVVGEFHLDSDRDVLIWKRLQMYLKKNKTLLQNVTRQSLHQYIIDQYNSWMLNTQHVAPMINGSEGKGAKDIAKYLLDISKGDQDMAERGWDFILNNYQHWEPFHKKQLKLLQISANLVNIIANVKRLSPAPAANVHNRFKAQQQ